MSVIHPHLAVARRELLEARRQALAMQADAAALFVDPTRATIRPLLHWSATVGQLDLLLASIDFLYRHGKD